MNSLEFGRFAVSMGVAAALLAGCGGSQPPIGTSAAIPHNGEIAQHLGDGSAPFVGPSSKSKALLYVASDVTNFVYIFNLSNGKLIKKLSGLNGPEGLCSDNSGNVFVTNNQAGNILEYPSGGSHPVATLDDSGYYPQDCSVDPISGDLAVVNLTGPSGRGNIAVYRNAQGSPTFYSDAAIKFFFSCGYDNGGNLFIEGYGGQSQVAELPQGGDEVVNFSNTFDGVVGIKWDGQYIAVGSIDGNPPPGSTIYRTVASNNSLDTVVSVPLNHGKHRVHLLYFTFYNGSVIATFNQHVGVWSYPAGGEMVKLIRNLSGASGVTVSLTPRR